MTTNGGLEDPMTAEPVKTPLRGNKGNQRKLHT
jgi:hypothetical protein